MPVVDEVIVTSKASTTRSAEAFSRYLIIMLAVLLVVYLAGFQLVRIPSFEQWGGSSFGPVLDYAFQTAGQNADIVVFGDSSALYALDPIQMSKELGSKVVNLPSTLGGLPIIGDMALERYLATNRPPRMILLYFCAWNLDYANAKGTRIFEGEEMLARHGSSRQVLLFALHHPREVFYFPFRVYGEMGPGALLRLVHPSKTLPEVAALRGHVANVLPFSPLPNDCALPDQLLDERRDGSVRKLLAKYAGPGTTTVLYLAPVPACHGVARLLATAGNSAGVTPPPVFSPQDFSADGYYAHLKPWAVKNATELTVAWVRSHDERKSAVH